jgi:branched-chain amino acid transport system ATP-binding protein
MSPLTAPPALELRGIESGYGSITVLRAASLVVEPGSAVALLGPNGAGKTTLLRTAAGLLRPSAGSVLVHGDDLTRREPNGRAKHGLCLIPEGRGVFPNLTVQENLLICTPPWVKRPRLDAVFEAFPILKDRRSQLAGALSGGQQRMVALSRATLAEPSVVLVDEASMGLAPVAVDVIFAALQTLASGGAALLVVEQYIDRALAMADSVYLIKKGTVTHAGAPDQLKGSSLMNEYMGGVPEPAGSAGNS